jgi:glycosyltransferase involved in cell wall biosynthesis
MAVPLASICVPSFNHARYVGECLDSALSQEFGDFEVVVADDASTDDTARVLAGYQHPRLSVFTQAARRGIGANWNDCVRHSRGRYVGLIPSDDKVRPNFLREQVAALEAHPEAGFAGCGVEQIGPDGEPLGFNIRANGTRADGVAYTANAAALPRYLDGPKVALTGTLFRRELFDRVGGFCENMTVCLDWDFWVRLLETHGEIYNPATLVQFRWHPTNTSGDATQYLQTFRESQEVFRRAGELLERLQGPRGEVLRSARSRLARKTLQIAARARGVPPDLGAEVARFDPRWGTRWRAWLLTSPLAPPLRFVNRCRDGVRDWAKRILRGRRTSTPRAHVAS